MIELIKKKYLLYLIFFLSLIVSYIFGENSSGGSKYDFLITKKYIDLFSLDLNSGIQVFKDDKQSHFPFFYILISYLNNLFGEKFVDYLYLITSSFIPLIFYKILKKRFSNSNKNILFVLSIIVFLSPYFRSSAVWLTNENFALLFFLFSINSFFNIKIDSQNYFKHTILCFFFLVLASYIRQYYSLFFIFYFFLVMQKLRLKEIFFVFVFNLILSLPALYWIFFIFEVEGFKTGFYWGFDYIFNLLVFTSLFFFYSIPFILNKYSFEKFKNNIFNERKKYLIILFFTLSLIIFYDIPELQRSGGIFYKLSQFTYINFFYFFSLTGLIILFFLNDKNLQNLIIYLTLVLAFPFILIYQKYYDPLIYILLLTLINSKYLDELMNKKKININLIFIYYFFFLIGTNYYYLEN